MKKLIYIIVAVFYFGTFSNVNAQNCTAATYYTEPATFTAEDEVTLYVDVTGCPTLAALNTLYLWIFVPNGPGPDGVGGNGDFCNGSNTELAMTKVDGNLWSFTFTPTELFNASPARIGTQIGFIPKAFAACQGNGDQTNDLFLSVESLVFIPSALRAFPDKFTQDDVVTFWFDANHPDVNSTLKSLTEVYMYTDADTQDGGFLQPASWDDVGTTPSQKFINRGNGLFTLTMIPSQFYGLQEGEMLDRIKIHVRSGPTPNFGGPEPPASLGDRFFTPIVADANTGDF
jgi:hypothetical protein